MGMRWPQGVLSGGGNVSTCYRQMTDRLCPTLAVMAGPPDGRVPAIQVGKRNSNPPKNDGFEKPQFEQPGSCNNHGDGQDFAWTSPGDDEEGDGADAAFRRCLSATYDSWH